MASKFAEILILIFNVISIICECLVYYVNSNSHIKLLCIYDLIQHVLKIFRIAVYGYSFKGSPYWICVLYSFINRFTHNGSLIMSCITIINFYLAIFHPIQFKNIYLKSRKYIFILSAVYSAIFPLIALYEPVIVGYSDEHVAESLNCSCAYRYRLYQFVLDSVACTIPFSIAEIYCTVRILYEIKITPRDIFKRQLSEKAHLSFSKLIRILFMCVSVTLFSFPYVYLDVISGTAVERKEKKEYEYLDLSNYYVAISGILLFLLLLGSPKTFIKKVKEKWNNNDSSSYYFSNNNNNTYCRSMDTGSEFHLRSIGTDYRTGSVDSGFDHFNLMHSNKNGSMDSGMDRFNALGSVKNISMDSGMDHSTYIYTNTINKKFYQNTSNID